MMEKKNKLRRVLNSLVAQDVSVSELGKEFYNLKDRVDNYKAPLIKVAVEGASIQTIKGKDGVNGKNGRDGKDGAKGFIGDKGDKGDRGKDARDGTDGVNGRDGKDGEQGLEGKEGKQGLPGQKGDKGNKGDKGDSGKDSKQDVKQLKSDLLTLIGNRGGGAMNRQNYIGNVDPLTKYTDINWNAGSNVTLTYSNNDQTKRVDITIAATGGSGTVRSINSIAIDTIAGDTVGTDYVYLISGTTTLTLPTAVGNENLYTVKNVGSGVVTVATTSSQTIDGSLTAVLPIQYQQISLISDTANWNVGV